MASVNFARSLAPTRSSCYSTFPQPMEFWDMSIRPPRSRVLGRVPTPSSQSLPGHVVCSHPAARRAAPAITLPVRQSGTLRGCSCSRQGLSGHSKRAASCTAALPPLSGDNNNLPTSLYPSPEDNRVVDFQLLQQYEQRGFLRHAQHPACDLHVWDYTTKAPSSGPVSKVTGEARSLVTDSHGKIIARSFSRFFGHGKSGSHSPEASATFTVQEKLDGSFGLLFFYEGAWHVASRCSFDNHVTKLAHCLLEQSYTTSKLDPTVTYVFELIHPANRIATDYGSRCEMVMLAAFKPDATESFPLPPEVVAAGFAPVRTFTGAEFGDVTKLADLDWQGAEGFVVRYSDGGRVKVKFPSYLAAYAPAPTLTVGSLWRSFESGTRLQGILSSGLCAREHVPWAEAIWLSFEQELEKRLQTVYKDHQKLSEEAAGDRKAYAKGALQHEDPAALFKLLSDGSGEAVRKAVLSGMNKSYGQSDELPQVI